MGRNSFASGVNPELLKKAQADPRNRPTKARVTPLQAQADKLRPNTPILYARVPLEPISVNELYANTPRGRVLTTKGKRFKRQLSEALQAAFRPAHVATPQPLRLTLAFEGKWETKEGEPRVRDCSNCVKALEDVLVTALGIDDKWFYEINISKKHTSKPLMIIQVEAI